jgi:hypothetical protein
MLLFLAIWCIFQLNIEGFGLSTTLHSLRFAVTSEKRNSIMELFNSYEPAMIKTFKQDNKKPTYRIPISKRNLATTFHSINETLHYLKHINQSSTVPEHILIPALQRCTVEHRTTVLYEIFDLLKQKEVSLNARVYSILIKGLLIHFKF